MTETLQPAPGSSGPIFIVGASRSGTALLRSILNQHAAVGIAGETHYFDDLRVRLEKLHKKPLTKEQEQLCQNYFMALNHRPYGHGGDPAHSTLDRKRLAEFARAIGPGADAYFEAYCRLHAEVAAKPIWGEKTPRHVYRIAEILARYPAARVITMVRDPRSVVLSYRDWKNQGGFDLDADPDHENAINEEAVRTRRSYHILILSLLWRATVASAVSARERFGEAHVRVQRYEDLVCEPEPTVRQLCTWLGLEYDPAMLTVPMHNSSFSRFATGAGISREPMRRWQTRLTAEEISTIELCCRRALIQAGYERSAVGVRPLALLRAWITLPMAVLRAWAANRSRIGNGMSYLLRRLRLTIAAGKRAR